MIPRFEIVEAKRRHCGAMARALRQDQRRATQAAGADVHRQLVQCFDQSAFRKAWLIDGRLGALGGVMGTFASGRGMVWLALTDEAAGYPKAVVEEARRQLSWLMQTKRELQASFFEDDEASIRLAIFLGFQLKGAAWEGPAATRAGRRLLAKEIAGNAEARILVGRVLMIPMAYREQD